MSGYEPELMEDDERRGIARARGFVITEDAEALLDNDGEAISELGLEAVDALGDQGASVAELAAGERAWRYGHVIVDEAQDLTPMQWRMVVRRARGGSMTLVGDLAQRSTGAPGSWRDHLPDSISDFEYRELTINYRSPAEVNRLAASVLAELAPELTPAQAIRSTGTEPVAVHSEDLAAGLVAVVASELEAVGRGRLAVIGASDAEVGACRPSPHLQFLDPKTSKGLEFDSVIVVEPQRIIERPAGLSLLFVALTRTTDRLTLLHSRALPELLTESLRAPTTPPSRR